AAAEGSRHFPRTMQRWRRADLRSRRQRCRVGADPRRQRQSHRWQRRLPRCCELRLHARSGIPRLPRRSRRSKATCRKRDKAMNLHRLAGLFSAIVLLAALSLGFATPARSQTDDPAFQERTYKNSAGASMPYRLFVPPGYDAKKKYPLVLWLHGAAGRGTDNVLQISQGNTLG